MPDNSIPMKITGDGARRLADLHSVLRDLQWVQVACVLVVKHLWAKESGAMIEALQTAALVRYCRTFESTAETRFSLGSYAIENLPPELKRAHQECLTLRNRYIARSGDDLLWNIPMAHVEKDAATGGHRVLRLSVEGHGMVVPSRDTMAGLYELARRLIPVVQEEIGKEKSRALTVMNAPKDAAPEAAQLPPTVLNSAGN